MHSDPRAGTAGYPIRVLAELSGVPPTTLRAWERRYGLLAPRRTASGHRLYSAADLATLRRVRARLEAGDTIGQAVRTLQQAPLPAAAPPRPAADGWERHRQRLLRAIERFDPAELERVYSELLMLFPVDAVVDRLLRPVIDALGRRWRERDAGIAEEHFFSAFLRNKLGARLHHQPAAARGQLLVGACLPGEQHELGLLLFALAASGLGYRFLHLGPDLPLDQAGLAAGRAGAAGIVLSATRSRLDPALRRDLAALVAGCGVPVCVGGPLAQAAGDALEELGAVALGTTPQAALERLAGVVPPFGGRP